jgi:hypothetical protein
MPRGRRVQHTSMPRRGQRELRPLAVQRNWRTRVLPPWRGAYRGARRDVFGRPGRFRCEGVPEQFNPIAGLEQVLQPRGIEQGAHPAGLTRHRRASPGCCRCCGAGCPGATRSTSSCPLPVSWLGTVVPTSCDGRRRGVPRRGRVVRTQSPRAIAHRDRSGTRHRLVSGLWSDPESPDRFGAFPGPAWAPVARRRTHRSTTVAGAAPAFNRLPNSPDRRDRSGTCDERMLTRTACPDKTRVHAWRAAKAVISCAQRGASSSCAR